MRFFLSSDIKKNKPLYYAVLFFLGFALLFWFASWLYFYSKYGFSRESLARYFFMDPEFPERISIAQISEDLHVGLFLHGMMLITLFSLLNLTELSAKVKLLSVVFTSLLALFYLLSDFLIIFIGAGSVYLKLFSFVLYQLSFLVIWLITTLYLIKDRIRLPSAVSLRNLSLLFSLFSLLFLFSNFLNFHSKMGFWVDGIRDYFLGNPELFIKRKSFEGFFKVFYPHLVAMAIYCLALAHLLPFAGLKRKTSLLVGVMLFVFSFLNSLSGLLLLYVSPYFAYLKLFSFWVFQSVAVGASIYLLVASLKKQSYTYLYI